MEEKVELPRAREHLEVKEISLSGAFSVWTFLSYQIRRIVGCVGKGRPENSAWRVGGAV